MTAAETLAALRRQGADLAAIDGQLYYRGFDCVLEDYDEAIEQHRAELIALLEAEETEAAVAEAGRIAQGGTT